MASVTKYITRSVLIFRHLLPSSSQICFRRSTSSYLNNNEITNDDSTNSDDRYNVFTYNLPLSGEQQVDVLQTLNSATLSDLSSYKLSKKAGQKLISTRQKNGPFKHVRDLLLVEGLGLKKIESLCYCIVNSDFVLPKAPKCELSRFKKFVIPNQSRPDKIVNSVVGLGINGSTIGWCLLQQLDDPLLANAQPEQDSAVLPNTSSGTKIPELEPGTWSVASLDCKELSALKMELPHLYDQLYGALIEIPPGDAYVFSDQSPVKAKMTHEQFIVSLVHGHLKGLLAVGLNGRAEREIPILPDDKNDTGIVYYAKESQASKALVLTDSAQRMVGLSATRSLLRGCDSTSLPGLSVPPEIGPLYNSLSPQAQCGLNSALLSALSFTVLAFPIKK